MEFFGKHLNRMLVIGAMLVILGTVFGSPVASALGFFMIFIGCLE